MYKQKEIQKKIKAANIENTKSLRLITAGKLYNMNLQLKNIIIAVYDQKIMFYQRKDFEETFDKKEEFV